MAAGGEALSSYLLRRVGAGLLLVWAAITLVFLLVEAAPGDPFMMDEGLVGDPEVARNLRALYGLDRSLPERYLRWLRAAAGWDWGVSLRARRPVTERVAEALPVTAILGLTALSVAVAAGGALGLAQTVLREARGAATGFPRLLERGIDRAALLAYCLPTFWVGLALIEIFSYRMGWLPPSHLTPPGGDPAAGLMARGAHWVLPVATLALAPAAAIARHLRASLLESGGEEFLAGARARGAGPAALLGRHRLRVCLGPTLALAGLHLPYLAGGALLVEVVFALPGMGRLAYEATLGRDYPVLAAITILVSIAVVAGSLLADLLQEWADPRLRRQPGPE